MEDKNWGQGHEEAIIEIPE